MKRASNAVGMRCTICVCAPPRHKKFKKKLLRVYQTGFQFLPFVDTYLLLVPLLKTAYFYCSE